jgi:hypothetical protein
MALRDQKDFLTKDVWLASALVHLLKAEPAYKVENGQTIFVFPKSVSLHRAIETYNSSILYEYAQVAKRLRAEMYLHRKG